MAKGKRQVQRPPARSRTRLHKPKLADPDSSVELVAQLTTLGLRLHNTLGDGNCLFRALSDQLYGTEAYHLTLRAEITAWMARFAERYEGFVEDDRSFEDHLRCMRQAGTYGGHLELSAFAHLTRKNVKVIQPGLVYVIEWDAGNGFPPSPRSLEPSALPPTPQEDVREVRRARRDKRRSSIEANTQVASGSGSGSSTAPAAPSGSDTVYVAYHDWEHFSSLRTLAGERPIIAYANVLPKNNGDEEYEDLPPEEPVRPAPPPIVQPTPAPVVAPVIPPPVPSAQPSTSTPAPPAPPVVVKRPRGRPRKYPLPVPAAQPPAPVASPSPLPAASIPTTPAPTPLLAPSPATRSTSPSATSSASTVASASTASSSNSNSVSASTASSSLPPITPSDSTALLSSSSVLQHHVQTQSYDQLQQQSTGSDIASSLALSEATVIGHPTPTSPFPSHQHSSSPPSSSAARTRAYDPTSSRSSPKRQFVDTTAEADDVNGFASEDSEARSAKRTRHGVGVGVGSHHRSVSGGAGAARSTLNPHTLAAIAGAGDTNGNGNGGSGSESRGTSMPPISRASSATTAASVATSTDLSEIEASLVNTGEDGDGEDEGGERGYVMVNNNDRDRGASAPPSSAPASEPMTKTASKEKDKKAVKAKTLTRRERKKLGTPKARRVILKVNGQRPGAIRPIGAQADEGPGPGQGEAPTWAANGSGRVDMRGFRELKI